MYVWHVPVPCSANNCDLWLLVTIGERFNSPLAHHATKHITHTFDTLTAIWHTRAALGMLETANQHSAPAQQQQQQHRLLAKAGHQNTTSANVVAATHNRCLAVCISTRLTWAYWCLLLWDSLFFCEYRAAAVYVMHLYESRTTASRDFSGTLLSINSVWCRSVAEASHDYVFFLTSLRA